MIPVRLTLAEFYRQIYKPHRLQAASPRTREVYEQSVRLLSRAAGHEVWLDEVCDELLLEFRQARLDQGRRTTTVNRDTRHLFALLHLARRKHLCCYEPDLDPLRPLKRIKRAWKIDEVRKILDAARCEAGLIVSPTMQRGLSASRFWMALIGTVFYTGLRITAAMNLRLRDLNLAAAILDVQAETQKNRAGQGIDLSPGACELLELVAEPARELLFPWPYDRTQDQWPALTRGLRRILSRAGLPQSCDDLWHKFRRTHATIITQILSLEEAAKALGHPNPLTTMGYVDFEQIAKRGPASMMPRLGIPAPQLRLFA